MTTLQRGSTAELKEPRTPAGKALLAKCGECVTLDDVLLIEEQTSVLLDISVSLDRERLNDAVREALYGWSEAEDIARRMSTYLQESKP